MPTRRWMTMWITFLLVMAIPFLILTGLTFKILTINLLSESLPRGLYFRSWGTPKVGDIVMTNVPQVIMNHYAKEIRKAGAEVPKQFSSLKILAGVAGDTFCRNSNTLTVNNFVAMVVVAQDSPPSQLTQGCKVIPDGMVFLLGKHKRSWDSRYLGPMRPEYLYGPFHRFCCDPPSEGQKGFERDIIKVPGRASILGVRG